MPVHYYSPVPDLGDLERRDIWARRSALRGVDFRPEAQVAYLLELGSRYGREWGWPSEPTKDPTEFHTENMSFSFGCAAAAHCMIRERKPKRIVEIGSGMSSIVLSAALKPNELEGAPSADYTIIDPYPASRLGALPGTQPSVLAQRVEVVEIGIFDQLEQGDILFIDSGHVVRIGGDVNFLFLDVLPRLKPGVVVHFHDIGLPFEYPKVYATNSNFRVFWTEAYLFAGLPRVQQRVRNAAWNGLSNPGTRRCFPRSVPALRSDAARGYEWKFLDRAPLSSQLVSRIKATPAVGSGGGQDDALGSVTTAFYAKR